MNFSAYNSISTTLLYIFICLSNEKEKKNIKNKCILVLNSETL